MKNKIRRADAKVLVVAEKFYSSPTPPEQSFPVFSQKTYYKSKGKIKGLLTKIFDVAKLPATFATSTFFLTYFLLSTSGMSFGGGSFLISSLFAGLITLPFFTLPYNFSHQLNFSDTRLIPQNMIDGLQEWIEEKYGVTFTDTQVIELLQNNSTVIDGYCYSLETDDDGNYFRVIQTVLNPTARELGALNTI